MDKKGKKNQEPTLVRADRWQLIPIDKLVKATWNYKADDEFLEGQLTQNLKRNGQLENIVVRELDTGFFEIVNGNHRLSPLQALNVKEVMTYNLGVISTIDAERIAVEMNETRFKTIDTELARLFKDMSSAYSVEDLGNTMPFSLEEIQAFQEMADYSFPDDPGAPPEGDGEGKKVTCPECGAEFIP